MVSRLLLDLAVFNGPMAFLDPLGLLALLSLVPLILLYIFRPDPRRVEIPTMGFLPTPEEEGGSNPVIRKLRRNRLLLIQMAALILLSLALASPYLPVGGTEYSENTVVVVDASASMAVGEDETRFDRAVSAAQNDVTGDTSVVVAGASTSVELEEGSAAEASAALSSLSVTDAEASLRSAVSQATALAADTGRVVVYSDFAGAESWRRPVEEARASGVTVVLEQFDGGGNDNVGVVDATVNGSTASVTVQSYADSTVERSLSMDDQSHTLSIQPDTRETATFTTPAGGGVVELEEGDDFAVDDSAYIARHPDGALDVLLVTGDGGTVESALESTPEVAVDVEVPPAPSFSSDDYDVVVYHDVDIDRLVARNARDSRAVAEAGGGVVFTAQDDLAEVDEGFVDVAAVDPGEVTDGGRVESSRGHPLVEDVELPEPREILRADATGDVVASSGGQPLVAERELGDGRTVYLGYITGSSDFDAGYRYPLFWRDLVHYAAGRETTSSSNRRTGETVDAGNLTMSTPAGDSSGTVVMEEAGFYETPRNVYSANLYSVEESDVSAEPVEDTAAGEAAERSQDASVPLDLTPVVALLALAAVVTELLYLRYRGDL